MKNYSRTFDEEFALKRERYSHQIVVGGYEAGASAALGAEALSSPSVSAMGYLGYI